MARSWDERTLPRLGWKVFLGSMDGFAGWLLAGDHISRRGHAVMRRPESPATASEPETMVQARWAQYEENLQAAQAAAAKPAGRRLKRSRSPPLTSKNTKTTSKLAGRSRRRKRQLSMLLKHAPPRRNKRHRLRRYPSPPARTG